MSVFRPEGHGSFTLLRLQIEWKVGLYEHFNYVSVIPFGCVVENIDTFLVCVHDVSPLFSQYFHYTTMAVVASNPEGIDSFRVGVVDIHELVLQHQLHELRTPLGRGNEEGEVAVGANSEVHVNCRQPSNVYKVRSIDSFYRIHNLLLLLS